MLYLLFHGNFWFILEHFFESVGPVAAEVFDEQKLFT